MFGEKITEYSNIHFCMSQCFKYILIFVRATFSIFAHPCIKKDTETLFGWFLSGVLTAQAVLNYVGLPCIIKSVFVFVFTLLQLSKINPIIRFLSMLFGYKIVSVLGRDTSEVVLGKDPLEVIV